MARQSRLRLAIRGPVYYSQRDEKAFYDWLRSITCVAEVGGRLRDVHITLKRRPSDSDLWDLLALLFRYRMNMKSLAAFRTTRNAKWFDDPKKFWHAKVFGRGTQRKSN